MLCTSIVNSRYERTLCRVCVIHNHIYLILIILITNQRHNIYFVHFNSRFLLLLLYLKKKNCCHYLIGCGHRNQHYADNRNFLSGILNRKNQTPNRFRMFSVRQHYYHISNICRMTNHVDRNQNRRDI